jgi:hypothetical protein
MNFFSYIGTKAHVCIVPRLVVEAELMHDPQLVLEPRGALPM